jgi:cell fate regulator YaaT (PSP1 superfamily)
MDSPEQTTPSTELTYEIVSVRFADLPNTYSYNRNHLNLRNGDLVVAETDRGDGVGTVVNDAIETCCDMSLPSLKKVVRKATKQDIERECERKELEKKAQRLCVERAGEFGLEMNLVTVQYFFDRSKAVFYFTADGRIDFRELVKGLAKALNTRIEMRQIGVRDKARLVGGIGCCGRELCCQSFLQDFEPVSVRMAKDQNLPLNPSKISGVCGRLMCCLTFEHDTYKKMSKSLPKCGKRVQLGSERGKVTRQNPLEGTVVVELEDGREIEVSPEEIEADSKD